MTLLKQANDNFKQARHSPTSQYGIAAIDWLIAHNYLQDCESCGGYHPRLQSHYVPDNRINGDMYECRSDVNRF